VLAAGAAALALLASAPVEVARAGFGSSFGALVASPDGGAWVQIDRSTRALLENRLGRYDDAIGRAGADHRFRSAASDGPLLGAAGTLGPDGQAWFSGGLTLIRSDVEGTVTRTALSEGLPGIGAVGPDGSLWAADDRTGTLFSVTAQGAVTKAPLRLPPCELHAIFADMRTAADGAVWIADAGCRRLVRLGPDGTPAKIVPTLDDAPSRLAADATGGMWFTQTFESSRGVGHVDATGTIERFALPEGRDVVTGIAATGDGGAYLAFGRCALGRIGADGALRFGPAPIPVAQVAADPAGGLWLASARRLVHAAPGPLTRGACDDRPPTIRLSPVLRERVTLARLRRGVRIAVREPALVYASADYGDDDHDTRMKLVRGRRGGALVFHVPKAALRRFEHARGARLSLYIEITDREGNTRELAREEIRVTR
jgi:streptogramin lyase